MRVSQKGCPGGSKKEEAKTNRSAMKSAEKSKKTKTKSKNEKQKKIRKEKCKPIIFPESPFN
jgi:hypothetical protein